ncbi:hypothetical protein C0993_004187, partial [Termitomyces sp. T159_Od127]
MKQHLSVAPDKSLFYCGGRKPFKGTAVQRAKQTGEKILAMAWDENWTEHENVRLTYSADGVKRFWENVSQAFAEISPGMVHVLLEDDVGIDDFVETSIWAR